MIPAFVERDGKTKWVDFSKLDLRGRLLTNFEPDEIFILKGKKFRVETIQLDPPLMVISPI